MINNNRKKVRINWFMWIIKLEWMNLCLWDVIAIVENRNCDEWVEEQTKWLFDWFIAFD